MSELIEAYFIFAEQHPQTLIWAFWIAAGALGFYIIAKQHRESAEAKEKQFQKMIAEARLIGAEAKRKRQRDAIAYLGKEQT